MNLPHKMFLLEIIISSAHAVSNICRVGVFIRACYIHPVVVLSVYNTASLIKPGLLQTRVSTLVHMPLILPELSSSHRPHICQLKSSKDQRFSISSTGEIDQSNKQLDGFAVQSAFPATLLYSDHNPRKHARFLSFHRDLVLVLVTPSVAATKNQTLHRSRADINDLF